MTNSRKKANTIVALFLGLAVVGVGIVGYFQYRVSADEIVRGYSSAKLNFDITVPQARTIKLKVTFTPLSGKKYYYKETTLQAANPGLNKFIYILRKLPPGLQANVSVTSESDTFLQTDGAKTVILPTDTVTNVGTFVLDLGQPITTATATPIPTPNQTVSAVASKTASVTATRTSTSPGTIAPPPVPQL